MLSMVMVEQPYCLSRRAAIILRALQVSTLCWGWGWGGKCCDKNLRPKHQHLTDIELGFSQHRTVDALNASSGGLYFAHRRGSEQCACTTSNEGTVHYIGAFA